MRVLNAAFLDVGMNGETSLSLLFRAQYLSEGPAVQCVSPSSLLEKPARTISIQDKADGTCDAMFRAFKGYKERISREESQKYRFELDVDGNSWSGRFRRLM